MVTNAVSSMQRMMTQQASSKKIVFIQCHISIFTNCVLAECRYEHWQLKFFVLFKKRYKALAKASPTAAD